MSSELVNTIATIAGIIVAVLGAFLFAFWIAMGIWTFNDIRSRSRDWLAILLACVLVLVFPVVGWVLYLMIRPKETLAEVYDRALEEEALLREIEETLACPGCGVPVKDTWVYCPQCHAQLQHTCPSCANLIRNEWEICVYCGAGRQAAQPAATPRRAPTATRRVRRPEGEPVERPLDAPAATSPGSTSTFEPGGFEEGDDTAAYRPVRVAK
ncbi:MAG: zinc ribbon domain-containing protein [Litorilinea sp.]